LEFLRGRDCVGTEGKKNGRRRQKKGERCLTLNVPTAVKSAGKAIGLKRKRGGSETKKNRFLPKFMNQAKNLEQLAKKWLRGSSLLKKDREKRKKESLPRKIPNWGGQRFR